MNFGSNTLIPLMLIAPNLLFIVYPPVDQLINTEEKSIIWIAFERIGQVGVFVMPLFYSIDLQVAGSFISLIIMAISLAGYYFCWGRYFRGRRTYSKLFEPLGAVPIPMAIFPVIYYVSAAWLQQSIFLLFATICLALGHLPISYWSAVKINGGKLHW